MQQAGRVWATDRNLLVERALLLVAALGLGLGLLPSCGSGEESGDLGGGGASAGAGGVPSFGGTAGIGGIADDGGGMGGVARVDEQPTKTLVQCDPALDACSEQTILHVSPSGFDGAAGTVLEPLRTVGEALDRTALMVNLGQSTPVIYLCATAGTYKETLRISQEHASIGIFGGFDCESFERVDQLAVVVSAEPSGHSVEHARQVTLGDLRLQSPDASGPGASSRALTVVESTGVRLLRSELLPGEGTPGAAGAGYAERAEPGAVGNPGHDACDLQGGTSGGGEAVATTCNGAETWSIGGLGAPGGSGWSGDAGASGEPGQPAGGSAGSAGCTAGGKGAPGHHGEHGVPSERLGSLTEDGYAPPVGRAGMPGELGNGGGGGGSAAKPPKCVVGASGGSGGGGGCPGAGAEGGQGGGGSFGLVSLRSEVTLSEVTIAVAAGGSGGPGGDGQVGGIPGPGADGGGPGDAIDADAACRGGPGGTGGYGGAGAGGAGGPAIGVAYTGIAPWGLGKVEFDLPTSAPGGPGGHRNTPAGDGKPGVVENSLSFDASWRAK